MLPYIGPGAGVAAQGMGAVELSRNTPNTNSVRDGDLDALLDAAEVVSNTLTSYSLKASLLKLSPKGTRLNACKMHSLILISMPTMSLT